MKREVREFLHLLSWPDTPPALHGRKVEVRSMAQLTACRGKLLSGKAGTPVHAGSFLRKREIVLDTELLEDRDELARIFAHELFHFVWARLDNASRRSYEALLDDEIRRRARGELGWSAEVRKQSLTVRDRAGRTRRWREYACESFCDSAAWLLAAAGRPHDEHTLARAFRRARRRWWEDFFARKEISI